MKKTGCEGTETAYVRERRVEGQGRGIIMRFVCMGTRRVFKKFENILLKQPNFRVLI